MVYIWVSNRWNGAKAICRKLIKKVFYKTFIGLGDMDTRKTKIISKFILSIFMAWGFLSAVNFASGQNPPLLEITIDEVHSSLSSGRVTCRSLVEFYLERIEAFGST